MFYQDYNGRGPSGSPRSSSFSSYERLSLPSSGNNLTQRSNSASRTIYYDPELQVSRPTSPPPSYRGNSDWSRSPSCSTSRAGSRSRSPFPSYTEALCKASRQLRERSLSRTTPPPEPQTTSLPPVSPRRRYGSGSKPPLPPSNSSSSNARIVASDFYRGKVKSIYEREPLFRDFVQNLHLEDGKVNLYKVETLDQIKNDFYRMVDDKWKRKKFCDPSAGSELGRKLYPWQNVVGKTEAEPASVRISRIQASRPRMTTPPPLPRITVYHRSTLK